MSRQTGAGSSDRQRFDALRLFRSENVGPRTFFDLISRYGSAAAALDAIPELSRHGGGRGNLRICSHDDAAAECERIARYDARLIAIDDADYPPLLRRIADPPPVLTLKGDAGLLTRPAIAIVGARNASALGRKIAARLASGLGAEGQVIVSGLARGIDGTAHQAALATGTVAVVAGGLDIVYPPEHEALAASICQHGVMVSEMAMGTRPTRTHFPRRNRLVSGIAAGTVIIDAAARSGSLITARNALEQNREVFAVPGSPLDPRAAGANRLIREGATLVRDVADILEGLNPMVRTLSQMTDSADADDRFSLADRDPAPFVDPGSDLREKVVGLLSVTPVEIDEVIRASDAPASAVVGIVLELELAGRVVRSHGQRVSLVP